MHALSRTGYLKHVIPGDDVPLGGVNNVPVNFGNETPEIEILGTWIRLSSMNDKKFKHLDLQYC